MSLGRPGGLVAKGGERGLHVRRLRPDLRRLEFIHDCDRDELPTPEPGLLHRPGQRGRRAIRAVEPHHDPPRHVDLPRIWPRIWLASTPSSLAPRPMSRVERHLIGWGWTWAVRRSVAD